MSLFDAPGRNCPFSYRYSPDVFRRLPEIEAETLYPSFVPGRGGS